MLDREYHKPALEYAALILKKLAFWRRDPPVASPAELAEFVETRAKYMAQTTLFGYLRTRAGTRFPSLFEDELFGYSLELAKWRIYLACLSDLMVYSCGLLAARSGDPKAAGELAVRLTDDILRHDDDTMSDLLDGYDEAREKVMVRIRNTPWASVEDDEGPFEGSQRALVEWAPVAPQLKEFDTDIVINSMRFKWKGIRDQLRERLDADGVLAARRDEAA